MLIVYSQNGVPVRLTEERWRHILHRHIEMGDQRERILETVTEPDIEILFKMGSKYSLFALRLRSAQDERL